MNVTYPNFREYISAVASHQLNKTRAAYREAYLKYRYTLSLEITLRNILKDHEPIKKVRGFPDHDPFVVYVPVPRLPKEPIAEYTKRNEEHMNQMKDAGESILKRMENGDYDDIVIADDDFLKAKIRAVDVRQELARFNNKDEERVGGGTLLHCYRFKLAKSTIEREASLAYAQRFGKIDVEEGRVGMQGDQVGREAVPTVLQNKGGDNSRLGADTLPSPPDEQEEAALAKGHMTNLDYQLRLEQGKQDYDAAFAKNYYEISGQHFEKDQSDDLFPSPFEANNETIWASDFDFSGLAMDLDDEAGNDDGSRALIVRER